MSAPCEGYDLVLGLPYLRSNLLFIDLAAMKLSFTGLETQSCPYCHSCLSANSVKPFSTRPHEPLSEPLSGPHEPLSEPLSRPHEPLSEPLSGPHEPLSEPLSGPHEPLSEPLSSHTSHCLNHYLG